uniref:RRM domain-containing protein n=2 Tax=Chrysotila carterae TaxID=13221 RepID=A0A7S4EVQ7_CHRCT
MELANTCTGNPSVSMQPPGAEPNVENKLFVGGCPPGSVEEELRKIFEPYGTIEEIFIMRGGSRSGMACAFVRYQTQQMAQMAIEAIHGQITLPNASEPLVVRWADAPGTRRRGNRRGGNTAGSSVGAGGSGGRELHGGVTGHGGQPMMLTPGGYGYGPMPVAMQMQIPMQALGGGYGSMPFYAQTVGGYGGGQLGYIPQQPTMMTFAQQQQQQAMGSTYGQQTPVMVHGSMGPVMTMPQYAYPGAMPPLGATAALHVPAERARTEG